MTTARRVIIGYIVMVGAPLCGIVAVMAYGRTLTAPAPVAGQWRLEFRNASGPLAACVGDRQTPTAILRVRQSGRYLEAHLRPGPQIDGPLLSGTIEGGRLHLDADGTAAGRCDPTVHLDAQVDGSAALAGVVTTRLGPIPFTAQPIAEPRALVPEDR